MPVSIYTMRVLYTLLDNDINTWYQKRVDGTYPTNYTFDQIKELEYNLESLGKAIELEEKYQT